MKRGAPQKKAKKQYVKPELTKHKNLREVTMNQLQYAAQCSYCDEPQ